jgi:hypothetical protein
MSLINDALKRARESQQKNSPRNAIPLIPGAIEPRSVTSWLLPLLIILLIIAACFFIGLAMANRTVTKIVVAPDISAPTPVPTQQVESVPEPVPPPAEIVVAAITNNQPDPVRVQGIGYDPVHPWAIINGHTVYLGDKVDGMRVTTISRDSITLAGNGQTNTLLLGQ